jgi:hypothetical protein
MVKSRVNLFKKKKNKVLQVTKKVNISKKKTLAKAPSNADSIYLTPSLSVALAKAPASAQAPASLSSSLSPLPESIMSSLPAPPKQMSSQSTNSSLSANKRVPGKIYTLTAMAIWKSNYFAGHDAGVLTMTQNDKRISAKDKTKIFLVGNTPGIFSKSYLQTILDHKWKIGHQIRVDYNPKYKSGDKTKLTNLTNITNKDAKWYNLDKDDFVWGKRLRMHNVH